MSKTKRKKILLILSHTGPGGDTQAIFNLLTALPALHSYEFHVLAHQRGEMHGEFRRFGKVYTFLLDNPSWTRRFLRRFFMPVFVALKKGYGRYLINKLNPDILYVNTVNENEYSQMAARSGRKLVVHIHEMGFVVSQRLRADWVETLLARSTRIISPAYAVSEYYRDVFGVDESKVSVLHETVSESRLTEVPIGPPLRQRLGFGPDTLLIGAAGSLIYRKGPDMFIRACALLQSRMPDKKLAFLWLGNAPAGAAHEVYYRALQKSIEREGLSSTFRFLSHTPAVGNFYAGLDIFVHPSRMEAFPLVILEALLFRKPVVAMDVAGVREVIDDQTGYLVKDRTPEGLAEGILYFLESEERRQMAGNAGRQRVLENFEAQVQAPKWLNLLENI